MRLLGPLAVLVFVACTSSSPDTATAVVERFYASTIAQKVNGAPTSAQLAALAPYLSDTLRALLDAARRRSEADAARAPDEKPAFVEGDLFSSLFEGPNAVHVIADSARGDQRVATVRMTATSANPPVTWTDRVVLTKSAGRFVIDDIEYGGSWDFANKGGLRASLVSGLATPP
ncbi:MAG TPA: hypothetical protein VM076_06520 [Gemmatimonadaceae bacterium]|nr:hypothetical protein [Gemmatimonadaceae bacterium]